MWVGGCGGMWVGGGGMLRWLTSASVLDPTPPHTGTVKQHFVCCGFSKVHNEPVDFYTTIKRQEVPAHDVLVTNPPFRCSPSPHFVLARRSKSRRLSGGVGR